MGITTESSLLKRKQLIQVGGNLLNTSNPLVMGILNITPDSFYDGGIYSDKSSILKRAEEILSDGGKIIDIGGMSTRPGSKKINNTDEIKRVLNTAELIKEEFPKAILSIDTFRSSVVDAVVNSIGAVIVNDISGGNFDSKMFETIAKYQLPYIMMHIQGTPEKMQDNPVYENITEDIIKHFSVRVDKLKSLGVNDIIIDPGFGFGKTLEHNYNLLKNLSDLQILELPIMVGLSRKSMIYKPINSNAENALHGTGVLHGLALERGANFLRVHDVKEAVEAITLMNIFNTSEN